MESVVAELKGIWLGDAAVYSQVPARCLLPLSKISVYLPVIIIEHNKSLVATTKCHLIAIIVPPIGEWLPIHNIAENNHVPWRREGKIVGSKS